MEKNQFNSDYLKLIRFSKVKKKLTSLKLVVVDFGELVLIRFSNTEGAARKKKEKKREHNVTIPFTSLH